MKVLIIEDERPAADKLTRLLTDVVPDVEIVNILGSVEKSVNWFNAGYANPDLVFMDIQLEDGLCFEIFENTDLKVPVIFTTAYDEYALRAFKVNSVDYLLKPISSEDLQRSIDKFNKVYRQQADYGKLEAVIRQLQPPTKERFLIRIGEHYRSIPVSDINCFYISERCTFILTGTGRSYPIDYSLDRVGQVINNHTFFRVNRNFIINFYAIRDMIAYSSSRIRIIVAGAEKEEILVSRERVSDFKEWIDR